MKECSKTHKTKKIKFMDFAYGLLCLFFSILIYFSYANWRKFKKKKYNNNNLQVWDFRLFITFWGIMIISIVASIIFFLQAATRWK